MGVISSSQPKRSLRDSMFLCIHGRANKRHWDLVWPANEPNHLQVFMSAQRMRAIDLVQFADCARACLLLFHKHALTFHMACVRSSTLATGKTIENIAKGASAWRPWTQLLRCFFCAERLQCFGGIAQQSPPLQAGCFMHTHESHTPQNLKSHLHSMQRTFRCILRAVSLLLAGAGVSGVLVERVLKQRLFVRRGWLHRFFKPGNRAWGDEHEQIRCQPQPPPPPRPPTPLHEAVCLKSCKFSI